MTIEQPDATVPRASLPTDQPFSGRDWSTPAHDSTMPARHLRRRTSDRVIGGVAGGLGDYLNVDPVLLRVAFAGLMIFGGAGLVLYVLGWLLIPAVDQQDSIVQAAARRVAQRTGRVGAILLVLVAVIILSPQLGNGFGGFYIQPEVFWALAIALVGIVLLLPREEPVAPRTTNAATNPEGWAGPVAPGAAVAAGGVAAPMAPGAMAAGPAPAPSWMWVRPDAPPRPRERSPLGWYVVAGVLLVVGILAVTANVAAVRVLPGQFFGAGLLALGIGLILGAWWGRARLLIVLGLAVLPVAAVAAFLTVPLDGGIGERYFRPTSLAELQPGYDIAGGRLAIDLTDLESGSEPVTLAASVGLGDLHVIVPKDATVDVTGTVQNGRLVLFGHEHVGTGLADHVAEAGRATGPTLILTLDAGIGQVWVERSNMEAN